MYIFKTNLEEQRENILFTLKSESPVAWKYWDLDEVCAVLCLVIQLCLTLCDPIDCSPPGSSVHEILQEKILEWVAMSSSRVSSQPRDWTQVSHIAGRLFTVWDTREAQMKYIE